MLVQSNSLTSTKHLFLKFQEKNPDFKRVASTMYEHLNVYLEKEKVIWGQFSKNVKLKGISASEQSSLHNQINKGETTLVFFYNRQKSLLYVGQLIGIFDREEPLINPSLKKYVPEYYHSRVGKLEKTRDDDSLIYVYFALKDLKKIDIDGVKNIYHHKTGQEILDVGGINSLLYAYLEKSFYDRLLVNTIQSPVEVMKLEEGTEENIDFNVGKLLEEVQAPPKSEIGMVDEHNSSKGKKIPSKRDYLKLQKKNTKIGHAGELLVLANEKMTLIEAGRQDLADLVKHVSATDGDGLGYDIKSFTESGEEKYIEVKTTMSGINTAFFIEESEVRFSRENEDTFYLVRVFNYDRVTGNAQFYTKKGNVEQNFSLKAKTYLAK
ncbi:DUF3883 domain-containing protein [Sutcliffiella horikoshii]|uniref:DUF3883 domain-containing protein n=1 Tax=Sutcliffiella horikoshii TaxID=79883 RepID=UPI001CFC83F2|nr:DUF3883 domain-containing protein [Sutcliffiella horikoshii]